MVEVEQWEPELSLLLAEQSLIFINMFQTFFFNFMYFIYLHNMLLRNKRFSVSKRRKEKPYSFLDLLHFGIPNIGSHAVISDVKAISEGENNNYSPINAF